MNRGKNGGPMTPLLVPRRGEDMTISRKGEELELGTLIINEVSAVKHLTIHQLLFRKR